MRRVSSRPVLGLALVVGICAAGAALAACDQLLNIDDHAVASADASGSDDGQGGGEGAVDGPSAIPEGAPPGAEGGGDARSDAPAGTDGGADADATTSGGGMDSGVDTGGGAGSDGGDAAPSHDAGDAATGCGPCPINTPTCVSGACMVRGPTMVAVSSFYVDSTEVTSAQYQTFVAAKGGDTSGQPAQCGWNTSYAPAGAANPANYPVTNVNWCDAHAYCAWAGKHLCGAIPGGGPLASALVLDQTKSQFFLACGGPNGGSDPNATPMCNATMGTGDLGPVGSFPGCQGFYTGLFDLEGNAAEWIDSCDKADGGTDSGAADMCQILGGSYQDETAYCTESFGYPRGSAAYPFGFRCCAGG
jgi:sulfatase modifying factor 1